MRLVLAPLLAVTAALPASAQEYPKRLPSSGGEVIIPSAPHQKAYDQYNYAPARRAGDFLYVSGVVVGPWGGEANDAAGFEAQVRRAFKQLEGILKASGATFDDVVMINSFHVWDGAGALDRDTQVRVINKVKAEYIKGPHPAWTAVGTTSLLAPNGVVEIQLIAWSPKR